MYIHIFLPVGRGGRGGMRGGRGGGMRGGRGRGGMRGRGRR